MADRELHPEDRFTWERIITRARLDGTIGGSGRIGAKGRQTRGGVAGVVFKAVALVYATHADAKDGSDVYPGDMRVAIEAETSPRTVKLVREKLLELGLLKQTGRHGHTPKYRLTLPDDLTELVDVLSPDEVDATAKAMRTKQRSARAKSRDGWSGGLPKEPPMGSPVDHPNTTDPESLGWSTGLPELANGWSGGPDMGGPVDTLNQPPTGHQGHQPPDDGGLDTAAHPLRAHEAEEPDSVVVVEEPKDCGRRHLDGIPGVPGKRADGRPACRWCRIEDDRRIRFSGEAAS
jgi:hypothetical protein